MAWSKLKNHLRKVAARTTEALDRAIGEGWQAVKRPGRGKLFAHPGYC